MDFDYDRSVPENLERFSDVSREQGVDFDVL